MIGKYPVYFPIKQLLQINIELNVLLFTSVSFFKQSSAGARGSQLKKSSLYEHFPKMLPWSKIVTLRAFDIKMSRVVITHFCR